MTGNGRYAEKATSLPWLTFNKLLLGKILAVFFFFLSFFIYLFIYSLKFDFCASTRAIGINYIYSFVVVFSSSISVYYIYMLLSQSQSQEHLVGTLFLYLDIYWVTKMFCVAWMRCMALTMCTFTLFSNRIVKICTTACFWYVSVCPNFSYARTYVTYWPNLC